MDLSKSILFEDDDLLVINKNAGVVVNRADTTKGMVTLQDMIEEYLGKDFFENEKIDKQTDFYKRTGLVHRLDKETSGIIIAAKNDDSFLKMQTLFKERLISKTYTALVHGFVRPEQGEIVVPVGRLPWNSKQFGIVAGGKESSTNYKVLNYYTLKINKKNQNLSLLELYPKTGRTHQIRVHLKYLNHPIFSDYLYAGRKTSRQDREILPRVFLHAKEISFIHPNNGQKITISAPLSQDLNEFINRLEDASEMLP